MHRGQHLPLRLGGLAARHRSRRRTLPPRWGRAGRALALSAGLAMGLVGCVLALTTPRVAVYRSGDVVWVGGSALRAEPGRADVFSGEAILAIRPLPGGGEVAAAATTVQGRSIQGVCRMAPPLAGRLEERCEFRDGSRRLAARDRLDITAGPAWRRRYSDGGEADIEVPPDGAPVPVPFLIGVP